MPFTNVDYNSNSFWSYPLYIRLRMAEELQQYGEIHSSTIRLMDEYDMNYRGNNEEGWL